MQVRRMRVQIETGRVSVLGTLQLPTEGYRSRTTDFLNAQESGFIALTDAEVQPHDGAPSAHEFVAVGTRHIISVVEVEDLGVVDDDAPTLQGINAVSVPPPAAE